ncbi:MAG: hypothetical protein RL716_314 [Actinomycetota bacterium]
MRLSEFKGLMADEFGEAYAAVLLEDLVLSELADQTANLAIKQGTDPKDVWLALCKSLGVPKSRWHGVHKDKKKPFEQNNEKKTRRDN